MTPNQIELVKGSWKKIEPITHKVGPLFYKKLFEIDPDLQSLFKGNLKEQGIRLMNMISKAVYLLDDLDTLVPVIEKLGERHADYGVQAAHYDSVSSALLNTLKAGLGRKFTPDVKNAWVETYSVLSKTMINAAAIKTNAIANKDDNVDQITKLTSEFYKGAVDQSGTASIMIDRDFNIIYVNQATIKLLEKHESTLQKKYSGFRANINSILGTCIDSFHANPSHQRQLLDNPNNLPWRADINIYHLIFELNVTAIRDSHGTYIGNSLEWQDVTEIRASATEVGRLSSAANGMTTNLMMADPSGIIVYMNPAVITMLQRRETQLRTALPNFDVNKIIGSNIDIFHKNPSHQQNLLRNPANLPYNADISIAQLQFNLNAIALADDQGNHLGTAVQWIDTTEEKDAQNQVERLINAAISGELDARIDTSNYQGFMQGLGDNINQLIQAMVQPISSAIEVIQSLAKGDLSRNMEGEYSGRFLDLSNAVNESMDNLSGMVSEIRIASSSVFDGAREIAQGNNDLSQRTEAQASSLEETASAMEEITTTVQQNSENASEATKKANGAMAKANSGSDVIVSAVSAMDEINKSSNQIADIIGVIDEIAFQTNLLALNAAVEAARAGEQGRGFAVVAAEVRNLAGRSAAAAKEIKGLIKNSVVAVEKGTRLVDDTGQTFTDLAEAVKEVVTMISDIDSASKEQAAGINEVSQAVSQMDEMTQQNAALVEQASASSKSMEDQAQALLNQIGFFKNGEVKNKSVSHSHLHLAASKRHVPAPTTPAPTRRVANADDEWEEF